MDFDLVKVLKESDQQPIDLALNSYYSFIFLKKNSIHETIASLKSPSIRILINCKTSDQYESVVDFFKPFKNISIKNAILFFDSDDHMITIISQRSRIYFYKISNETSDHIFSGKLSDPLEGEEVRLFCWLFDNAWNALDKNSILEKRNIFQQDFVDIASHQLRNPILPIIGFSKTLKSKISDPDMVDYLNIIIKNAEKLKNIANDILDISKIEANPSKLFFENFNLCELLDNITRDYNQFSSKDSSGIRFLFQESSRQLFIEADKEYVKQAFENILNNSYFFTKKNGGNRIMISAIRHDEDREATVLIEDEGPGIPDENPERIFTKFYPNSGGAGLGLFISKKIIEIHGGSIVVENRVDDIGAKFLIKIPLKAPDISYHLTELDSVSNTKLLIIEDFSENLQSIKQEIIDLGYEVDYFDDPYKAIESFIPGKYSLVFLGINVQGLDGFDLYDDLKKRDKKIKGYFMSSNKINRDAMETLNNNLMYDHFIFKPFSVSSFVKILRNEQST